MTYNNIGTTSSPELAELPSGGNTGSTVVGTPTVLLNKPTPIIAVITSTMTPQEDDNLDRKMPGSVRH